MRVAIVGATGAVGQTMCRVLEERQFPLDCLYLLASNKSVGKVERVNKENIEVQDLADFDFSLVDIALFSAGGEVSKQYAPIAAASGAIVIDNTSYFRQDPDVPLVITEVNPERISDYHKKNIIANPNCSTMQMLVALKPIHDAVGISRINVATYQSVSGTGKRAITELIDQLGQLLNGKPVTPSVYPHQIAFNALPHIDVFLENGYSKEEMKMVWETQKILEDDRIVVNPTAVRVPVLYGHSEAVHLETRASISPEEVTELLRAAPGVVVSDAQEDYPTAFTHAIGRDEVFVGRIRQDISHPNGLNLWIVADNIRKGAATNAVQIAEILQRDYL